jgi:hypothetical protein
MRTTIVILFLICGSLLISCSGSRLPKIKEPETLRKDCANLYNQFPNEILTNGLGRVFVISSGFIPKEKWTHTILALNPFQVTKSKYGVRILIHAGKDGGAGYYVFIDPAVLPPSVPLSRWGLYPKKIACISKRQNSVEFTSLKNQR